MFPLILNHIYTQRVGQPQRKQWSISQGERVASYSLSLFVQLLHLLNINR